MPIQDELRQLDCRCETLKAAFLRGLAGDLSLDQEVSYPTQHVAAVGCCCVAFPEATRRAINLRVGRRRRKGVFAVSFWTAWSPPTPLVNELAQRFPQLDFELLYNERDGGFAGYCDWRNGEIISDDECRDAEGVIAMFTDRDWEDELSEWLPAAADDDDDDVDAHHG